MKFYNREQELEQLQQIREQSLHHAQFTVITGRRRIGKTQLLLKATEEQPTLYFLVSRKAEPFLCQDFQQEMADKLDIQMPETVMTFGKLFQYLMQFSAKQSFNLIIDEFHEFFNINPSIYSDIQRYWEMHKMRSRINLLVCGSVHSLMYKILEDSQAPLLGCATSSIHVRPFSVSELKDILQEHNPASTPDDLLALYAFTGGAAKYVQLLIDSRALTVKAMLDCIIREDSPFITDGKNILIDDFGKDYAVYFSIVAAVANSESTRNRIETYTGREVGGYLTRLEKDYALISKQIPLFSKTEIKNVRYTMEDNYFMFWFRYIYRYAHLIELAQYDVLKQIIEQDYSAFSENVLERYFREKLIEEGDFTQVGGYWDKSGDNVINLMAVNEETKTVLVTEINRNEQHAHYNAQKDKVAIMIAKIGQLEEYVFDYKGLALPDIFSLEQ